MPNTIIERYDVYRAMGKSPEEASALTGSSEMDTRTLDGTVGMGMNKQVLSAAAYMDNDVYSPVEAALAADALELDLYNNDLFPEGTHNAKRQWWKPLVEGAMVVGETLAVPQQLIWQGLADAAGEGDWRKAIPEWAAPDDWKKKGITHELIMVGDVLDEYIGGKYHEKLKELDEKGGISKYGAGWGLKLTEFVADVALDPMNLIVGAGIGKKLAKEGRKLLPKAVQIEQGIKTANKSGTLNDYTSVKGIMAKYIDELEAEALAAPSEAVAKKLALAKSAAKEIDDEVDYLMSRGRHSDELATIPTNRPPKLDKPGPDATPEELAAYKVQKEANDALAQPLRFEDLDSETLLARLEFGPDDTEVLSETLGRVLRGEDPKGLLVRGLLDNVAPTSTSLELAIHGISKNGMITRELASSLEAFHEVVQIRGKGMNMLIKVKDDLKIARDELAQAAKPKAAGVAADAAAPGARTVETIASEAAEIKNAMLAGKATASTLRKELAAGVAAAKKGLATAKKPVVAAADNVAASITEDVPAMANRTAYRGTETYKKLPKARKDTLVNLESQYDKARDALVKYRTKIGYYETKTKAVLNDETLLKLNDRLTAAGKNLNAAKRDFGIPIKAGKPLKLPKSKGVVSEEAVAKATKELEDAEAALKAMDDPNSAFEMNRAKLKALKDETAELKAKAAEARKAGKVKTVDEEALEAAKKKVAELEEHHAEVLARSQTAAAEIKHFKEFGTFSEAASTKLNVKLPSGPRRSIFSASDFVDTKRFGLRVFTAGLYPGSVIPTMNFTVVNRAIREPMRVLESHLPGAWEIVRGGQKSKEAFIKGSIGKLKRIYEDAGVLDSSHGQTVAKKVFGVDAPAKMRVNAQRDELLYRLAGTDPADGAYASYVAMADEKLLKAAKELKEFNDEIAPRLGMPPGMYIEAYMHRVIKKSWFDKGLPREFIGASKVNGVPTFMKDRLGEGNYIVSATQAMDIYVRGVAKHLYTDPSLDMLQKMANAAAKSNPSKKWLAGYASDLIANVKGDPSALSGALQKMGFGQMEDPARAAAAAVGSLTHSAALTGNIRYPIMSIIQAINSTAAEYGMLRTLKGMAAMSTAKGRYVARAAGMGEQHMAHFDDLQGAWSKVASELRVLTPSISDTEFIIRGLTFHTALDENMTRLGIKALGDITDTKVMREVIGKAARDSEDINHVFGVYGKPVAFGRFSRTGSALATQFMSFPMKQTETIISNSIKNPGFFTDYLLIAGQMQSIAGRANLDIGPFVGFGYGDFASRDISSIPVDILTSGVKAFTAIYDFDMPSYEKKKLFDEFKKNSMMLAPMSRAVKNTKATIHELQTGEQRGNVSGNPYGYKGGDLQRKLNLSLVEKDTMYDEGGEWMAILTRLNSKQKRMKADADLQQRLNRGERRRLAEAIVKEGREYYRNGGTKPFDQNKVNKLTLELSRLGVPLGKTDINAILKNEQDSYVLEERLRDELPELGDEFREVDDHPFYSGGY